jgi:hypothetical protein
VAKQNVPKVGLRGPYSGQPIHFAAATGAGASYRVAAVGYRWTPSGVRGVEPVGINQGRRGQDVRDLAGHPDYTAPPGKDAVTRRRARKYLGGPILI